MGQMSQGKFEKSRVTKQRILDAAIRLFLEEGYDKATMRNIAKEARLAPGATYYHFKSKEHIIFYYYERSYEEQLEKVEEVLRSQTELKARIAGTVKAHLEIARPYHQISKILFKVAADPSHPLSPFSKESKSTREKDVVVFREVTAGASDRIPKSIGEKLPELLWLFKMVMILFWVYDSSPDQGNTFRLIDRSAELISRLVQLSNLPMAKGLLDSVVDMIFEFKPFT
jgi:AcrR family transcriptional regulator